MFTLKCLWCGQNFISQFRNQKYCSQNCYHDNRGILTETQRICQYCGIAFIAKKNRHREYCSLDCAYKARIIIKQCPVCLMEFNPGWKKQMYCSTICKGIAQSKIQTGINNPNWKGGIDCYGSNWANISRKALERDNFTCQKCFATGIYLEAHHIIPAAFYRNPKLANVAFNLITLCRRCHNGLRQLGTMAIPEMLKMRKAYQTQDW